MKIIKKALPEWACLRERSVKRKYDKQTINEMRCFKKGYGFGTTTKVQSLPREPGGLG